MLRIATMAQASSKRKPDEVVKLQHHVGSPGHVMLFMYNGKQDFKQRVPAFSVLPFVYLAFALLASGGAVAQEAAFRTPGFTLCFAPRPPACVNSPLIARETAVREACDRQITWHTDQIFAYRACLEKEIRRAVREVNDVAAIARCRKAGRSRCAASDVVSRQ
jgi:hypothetical protein